MAPDGRRPFDFRRSGLRRDARRRDGRPRHIPSLDLQQGRLQALSWNHCSFAIRGLDQRPESPFTITGIYIYQLSHLLLSERKMLIQVTSLVSLGSFLKSTHHTATDDSSACLRVIMRMFRRWSFAFCFAAGLPPVQHRAWAFLYRSISCITRCHTFRRSSVKLSCSLSLRRLTVSSTRIFSHEVAPGAGTTLPSSSKAIKPTSSSSVGSIRYIISDSSHLLL